jgi:hypothetical protein
MAAKTAEGETNPLLKADVKALVDNGWTLDEDTLVKTYYFKTYTKVAVSTTSPWNSCPSC